MPRTHLDQLAARFVFRWALRRLGFCLFVFFLGLKAQSQEVSPSPAGGLNRQQAPGASQKKSKKWRLRSHTDLYGYYTYQQPASFVDNPGNQVIAIPQNQIQFEVRPDLKAQYGDNLNLILRPRLEFYRQEVTQTDPNSTQSTSQGKLDLTDAFVDERWNDNTGLSLGLQNYQWGPAELLTPSNYLIHFNPQNRSFFYVQKGNVLARLNYSPTERVSYVLIDELASNNDPYWISGDSFSPKILAKLEIQGENKINYMGLTLGQADLGKSYFGEYFNFYPTEGWSIYADGRHTTGRVNDVPQANASGSYDMVQPSVADNSLYHLLIVGTRWESAWDWRLEYLYNSAGFSRVQMQEAESGIFSPNAVTNMARLAKPGLEFLGRSYAYASVRIPDLGSKKNLNLYWRFLLSGTDGSSSTQFDVEKAWNDRLVIYLESFAFAGGRNSELHSVDNAQVYAGFKFTL